MSDLMSVIAPKPPEPVPGADRAAAPPWWAPWLLGGLIVVGFYALAFASMFGGNETLMVVMFTAAVSLTAAVGGWCYGSSSSSARKDQANAATSTAAIAALAQSAPAPVPPPSPPAPPIPPAAGAEQRSPDAEIEALRPQHPQP